VGLIGFGCFMAGCLATEAVFGEGYWTGNAWAPSPSCAAAGLLTMLFNWVKAERAFRRRAAEIISGQEPSPPPDDTFCWIPVRYWPGIYFGLGFAGLFMWGRG
jgi:hypothetical protein